MFEYEVFDNILCVKGIGKTNNKGFYIDFLILLLLNISSQPHSTRDTMKMEIYLC